MGTPDFTIADVLAWARTKPADERYEFTEPDTCALAQFGLATDRPNLVGLTSSEIERLTSRDFLLALVGVSDEPTSFGALVDRLAKLCPNAPATEWAAIGAYLAEIESVSV